ncbi:MAG: oligosaccharide flippase family protein [Candidatus Buchananbacteria bacterium]
MLDNPNNKIHKLLRWSEKWTKTDMVYFTKGGFWLVLSQIFSSLIAFLISVAFANLISKDLYGNFKYVISLSAIIGAFSLSGMNLAITKAVAQGKDGSYKRAIIVQAKWSVLQFVVALACFGYYFYIGNHTIAYAMLIVGILSPVVNTFNTCIGFLNGKKDFKNIYLYNLLSSLVGLIFMTLSMVLFKNVIFLVFIYFASSSISYIFLHFKTIRHYKPNSEEDPGAMKYGKHMSIINVASIVAGSIDKIIVFNVLGPAQLAIYYFAVAAPDQFRGVAKIISSLTFPKFSAHKEGNLKKKLAFNTLGLIVISIIVVIIYILLAPFLYKIFFPKYLDSVLYSQIFSLALIANTAVAPLLSYVQAKAKIINIYQYNISVSIIQIAIVVTMAFFWGIIGVIFARIIYSVINLLILFTFSRTIKVTSLPQ